MRVTCFSENLCNFAVNYKNYPNNIFYEQKALCTTITGLYIFGTS